MCKDLKSKMKECSIEKKALSEVMKGYSMWRHHDLHFLSSSFSCKTC